MKKHLILLLLVWLQFAVTAQNVVQMEYFIDTDPGTGNATPITGFTSGADIPIAFTASTANLQAGFHHLYVRTKGSDGNWSHTTRRTIEIIATYDFKDVTNAECFFDTDPGVGNGIPITGFSSSVDISITFSANTSLFTPGFHKLYIRAKDSDGNWSHTIRKTMEVINEDATVSVIGVEYFLHTDPGAGSAPYSSFATALPDGTFTFNIPLAMVGTGMDTLYLRVKDNTNNNWSLTQLFIKDFAALPLTFLQFNGRIVNNDALLTWKTANEINTFNFIVERSTDQIHYAAVGTVPANNRPGIQQYQFIDSTISRLNERTVYYRLKQQDNDGNHKYSTIVLLRLSGGNNLVNVYPNPAINELHIAINNLQTDKLQWQIVDALGRKLLQGEKHLITGANNYSINIQSLKAGYYNLLLQTGENVQYFKFIKH